MLLALWISGLYFAFIDVRTHRIPNRSLLVLILILLGFAIHTGKDLFFVSALISLLLGTALSVFAGLGFGDVKLLTILSFFVIAPTRQDLLLFLSGVAIASALALIVALLRGGKSSDSIAMAPSIFAGAILCASLT
jgi:prepilin peptidase CpaA